MYKKILAVATLAFFLLPVEGAFAQQGTIAGTVVDSTTSNTLPGVNVVITDLNRGAATDASGQFQIESVPVGEYTLELSFVGYTTKRVPVEVDADETTNLRVQLAPSEVQLQNIVVTALGIERQERSLGYSVGTVDGAALEQAGETNFISTLAGKTAGLSVSSSSQMGGSARLELRGASSISGDSQPLIVVDGVPINNQTFNSTSQSLGFGGFDYGNAANMINPSSVESISILKGASAAALYGSRAANGVIEITTKDGTREQGIGVSFQTSVTVGDLYNLPDYQNKYGGGASPNFSMNSQGQLIADYGTDQSWGPRLDGREVREWFSWDDVNGLAGETTPWDAHPNNVENYFNRSLTSNTSLSFSQGGDTYNYRLSLDNTSQRGAAPKASLSRQSLGFNGSIDLTDRLTASANATFVNEAANRRPGSGYTNAQGAWLQFNHFGQRQIDLSDDAPMQDIMRPDGTQRSWNWSNSTTAPLTGDIIYANNPYWIRRKNYQNDDTQRLFGKVQVSYNVTDALSVSANTRTDYYTERRADRIAVGSVELSSYGESVREVQETHFTANADYNGELTDQVTLQATAGVDYRYNNYSNNSGSTEGGLASPGVYTLENSISRPSVTDYFQQEGLIGVYGDVSFGYNELLYVGGSLRNDWASTLPADNNAYLYPSANASFVFSSLPALQDSDILSFGKVRVGWSQVGRDTEPYQLSFTYPTGTPYNGRPLKSLPGNLPNSTLKRELTTSFEVGARAQFFQNRLGLDVTYYQNETQDLIQNVGASRASGFGSRTLNAGRISNTGVEVQMNMTPVATQTFNWDLTFNWSKNVNEVEELAEGVENLPLQGFASPPFGPQLVAREGEPLGTFWGNGFKRVDGKKVVSSAGFFESEGPRVLGTYRPDWQGSASTTISYGNFTASVLIDGQKGGQIWSLSNLFGLYSGMFASTASKNIRQLGMLPEGSVCANSSCSEVEPFYGLGGTEGNPTTAFGPAKYVFQTLFGNHEAHMYPATFIKLREATINYSMPQRWFSDVPVQQFNISLVGRNLATLLRYTPNFDPTAITMSADNRQGLETGQLPPQRSIGIRLRATF